MKVWNIRLTRKRAAALVMALGAAMIALLAALGGGGEPELPPQETLDLSTNEGRLAYLESLGWEVDSEPVETMQFLLETPLQEPFFTYNVLQKSQGFDLEQWAGQQLNRCTYAVTNYPGGRTGVQVNLYLCDNQVVAGDVCASGADGFRNPLAYPAL